MYIYINCVYIYKYKLYTCMQQLMTALLSIFHPVSVFGFSPSKGCGEERHQADGRGAEVHPRQGRGAPGPENGERLGISAFRMANPKGKMG